jgi:hypothetical protein
VEWARAFAPGETPYKKPATPARDQLYLQKHNGDRLHFPKVSARDSENRIPRGEIFESFAGNNRSSRTWIGDENQKIGGTHGFHRLRVGLVTGQMGV